MSGNGPKHDSDASPPPSNRDHTQCICVFAASSTVHVHLPQPLQHVLIHPVSRPAGKLELLKGPPGPARASEVLGPVVLAAIAASSTVQIHLPQPLQHSLVRLLSCLAQGVASRYTLA